MNLTASDRNALLRLASTLPVGSNERRAILSNLTTAKQAADKEASDAFASYILSKQGGDPISVNEVEGFVKGLGIRVNEGGRKKKPGPRWQPGYRVCIKAEKHKGDGVEVYRENDRRIGVVVNDGGGQKGDPVTVKFGGDEVVFPNAQRSRGVGMYKATDYSNMKGYGPIEIIYKADPSSRPNPDQKQIAAEYVERGADRGTKRSLNYYSGYVFVAAKGKNGFYFSILAQQRASQDACAEGFPFRSFNPGKAEVLYIGKLGKRPRGWESEWQGMQEAAEL
tara:strand:+ start:2052 stop:2891 length:840 start_codon:yes stop_codon:yes gene_type:complete